LLICIVLSHCILQGWVTVLTLDYKVLLVIIITSKLRSNIVVLRLKKTTSRHATNIINKTCKIFQWDVIGCVHRLNNKCNTDVGYKKTEVVPTTILYVQSTVTHSALTHNSLSLSGFVFRCSCLCESCFISIRWTYLGFLSPSLSQSPFPSLSIFDTHSLSLSHTHTHTHIFFLFLSFFLQKLATLSGRTNSYKFASTENKLLD